MNLDYDEINFYDDRAHHYEDFWEGRDYEHLSEVIAINKLLGDRRYSIALDYGGGYGRLSRTILKFSNQLYVADPSTKQLNLARDKLQSELNIEYMLLNKEGVIPIDDNSFDLLVMIRVSHHLTNISSTFAEINRVLKPGGQAVIEIANYSHFVNRLKYYLRLKKLPQHPVQIGEVANGLMDDTPFVNHSPVTVSNMLKENNLVVLKKLSVSNLRSEILKRSLNLRLMLKIETVLQAVLAPILFGPSIFYLVEKP
jgi:SAM-dependent methyltransferase